MRVNEGITKLPDSTTGSEVALVDYLEIWESTT